MGLVKWLTGHGYRGHGRRCALTFRADSGSSFSFGLVEADGSTRTVGSWNILDSDAFDAWLQTTDEPMTEAETKGLIERTDT